jgi:hypothetical protein
MGQRLVGRAADGLPPRQFERKNVLGVVRDAGRLSYIGLLSRE